MTQTGTDYGPEKVEPEGADWKLSVRGISDGATMSRALFPHGVPHGVTITEGITITEPHPSGEFILHGLTNEAMDAMEPWWAHYLGQAMQSAAAPPSHEHGHSHGMGHEQPGGAGHEHRTPEELKEYILDGAHGVFTVAEIAGMFAEEGSAIAVVGEVAGGFGDVLAVAVVLYATWQAFGEGLRDEENRGAIYGLFWQVLGHPDQDPMYNQDDFYAKLPWDSFDEMKQAFHEGVAKGRAMGADPKAHNRVAAAIAYRMHADGLSDKMAADMVLNDTWHQASGGSRPTFVDFP